MYIIIKRDKAEHIDNKLHKMKECISELIECFAEAKEEHEYREMARGRGGRYMTHSREHERMNEDFDDDYERDYARGRGRGRY